MEIVVKQRFAQEAGVKAGYSVFQLRSRGRTVEGAEGDRELPAPRAAGGTRILVSAWAPPAALPRSRLQKHCPCSLTHLHVKPSYGQHEQKKNIAVPL